MFKFKKMLLLCFSLAMSLQIYAQNQDGLARVNKIQGIEAYFLSEPLREYEVVLGKKSGLKITSLFTRGLLNESTSDKANQFVKRVIKKAEGENKEFDAIIYTGGKKVVAVKFKGEATLANKGIGKVKTIKGLEVYVLSEPLKEYEVVNQKTSGVKIKSILTYGWINNSIENDMSEFTRRANRDAKNDDKTVDSIIYSSGKSIVGAKFK